MGGAIGMLVAMHLKGRLRDRAAAAGIFVYQFAPIRVANRDLVQYTDRALAGRILRVTNDNDALTGFALCKYSNGRGSSTCVTVFDVERQQWRTLIIDNIIHFGERY